VARERTVKGLAKRIELTYYHKPHFFRRWWRHLCIGATALAVLWIVVEAVRGDQRIYTSGPVATAHRMFETDCARCHVDLPKPAPGPPAGATATGPGIPVPRPTIVPAAAGRGGYFARVSDGACLACHDGTIHHDNMTQDLTCATCHLEHKVGNTLARMSDRHCTVCHADLQVKDGKPRFEAKVTDLVQHPEIALFRKNLKDQTQIKFNHKAHAKEVRGPSGPVTLGCASCHLEDDAGKYMKAVTYEVHCKACHPLSTSDDVAVPHQRPEVIQGFLLVRAPAKAAPAGAAAPAKPADKPAEEGTGRKRPGSAGIPRHEVRLASLFAASAVMADGGQLPILLAQRKRGGDAEEEEKPAAAAPSAAPSGGAGGGVGSGAAAAKVKELLADKRQGCAYCHTVQPAEPLATIVPPKIPTRWQQQAHFDHRAHRPLACSACHEAARTSEDTADILLPKLQVCRECHRDGGGARAACVECHLYHDRAKERSSDGPFPTVPKFVATDGRAATPPAPAEKKP
jgi:hypothetical protein